MPMWSKISAGLVLAIALLGLAGLKASSGKLGSITQPHGTTYYNGTGPKAPPLPCKPEKDIRAAISRVHAKYDRYAGESLQAFEQRATHLKGLPPLRVDTLYVITEDEELRDGKSVLFIGLSSNCVSTVFSFPAPLYNELAMGPGDGA